MNACNPTPPLFLHLKLIGKPTFRIQVLADTGATRSLISLSTANKQGCEITETDVRLSAADGTKIDVAGMSSLQVVKKGQLVHTIVAIVSQNIMQTIVGWQDLKAMGVISSDWPAMPQLTTKDTIHAVDGEEKQLGELKIQMLNKYNTVFSDTINKKPIAGTPMKIQLWDDIEITPSEMLRCQGHAGQSASVSNEARARARGSRDHSEGRQANHLDKPRILRPQAQPGCQVCHRLRRSSRTEQQILRPTHPFPTAHDIVQAIPPSARYFATADSVHSYFQLALDEESRDLTTFMLPSGRWQYLRGPMGLSATLDNWCRKSNFVIKGKENTRKIVDNILCWGATMQELMSKLDTILLRYKAIGITLSIKKFKISKEVAFAGYVVKQGAIRPSPERTIALKEFPRPQNIHELRSFLGLAQQLAGFIPDLAHASEPLCHLLKKEHKYTWTIYLQDAFDAVVKILTCDLVRINFDPSKPTILLTDASRLKGLALHWCTQK
jgi:hypothetical protein